MKDHNNQWIKVHRDGEISPKTAQVQRQKLSTKRQFSDKRLFTLSEAAVYLGRSEWAVRRLIWSGELPHIRQGRRVHLDVRDMEQFIDRNRVAA